MDIWDPSLMEPLNVPILEDVMSLALENEIQLMQEVSGMLEYCPSQSSTESSGNLGALFNRSA